ncbi:NUDIX domain-containing protein [Agrococcus sp. Ld7]|uniref:NUDIX domain-containing protein n=1 Tax=Agrococcus sp. Ld7 TaxID=649148 RepID=UPI00386B59FB
MDDDARPERIRRSARVVCVDDEGAALLLLHRWSAPAVPPRWLTIGGGIEPGETERTAALRELMEETGQRAVDGDLVGPVRHLRQATPPGHRYDRLDMTTFVWRTPRFAPDAAGREPGEQRAIVDERWWTAAEIAASDAPFDREDVAGTLALLAREEPLPGECVRVRATKWDGSPHWQYDAIALGSDAAGHWLGVDGASTTFRRPGREPFVGDARKVTLVPRRPLAMLDGTWALLHWFDGRQQILYADIATPPELSRRADGWYLEYCDLDLDVVRDPGRLAWIDDEGEFAEHAASMQYPSWVRERARATADALLASTQAGTAPGEHARHGWLAALDRLLRRGD